MSPSSRLVLQAAGRSCTSDACKSLLSKETDHIGQKRPAILFAQIMRVSRCSFYALVSEVSNETCSIHSTLLFRRFQGHLRRNFFFKKNHELVSKVSNETCSSALSFLTGRPLRDIRNRPSIQVKKICYLWHTCASQPEASKET